MPLYEYQCDACAHRFEVIQKFSDELVKICPKCGGSVHKEVSSPAFQFKGSGFYATDYPKKDSSGGKPQSGDTESKGGADKDRKADKDKKSESKSETKKETPDSSSSTTPKAS